MGGFRIIILILCLTFTFVSIIAQDIQVKSFSLQIEPMTVPMQRTDANGSVCALVKVIIPDAQATYEGNVIGECEYKFAEYWCYLSPGSKQLKVKCSKCEPLMVNFEYPLETKQIYELVLTIPQPNYAEVTDSIVSVNRMEALMRNLIQTRAENICFRRGKLFPYYIRENGTEKVGFLDKDLKIAFPENYRNLENASRSVNDVDWSVNLDFYWVKDSNGMYGLIDSNGNKITSFKYTKIYEPKDELLYARIVLAIDSLENGFILNRITGEVINRIPKWDFVDDGYFLKQPTSLLKYTDINNHKDYFIDKITGMSRNIKIPKGYYFKEFLPYNHLRFQNRKSLNQKILNSESLTVSEDLFAKRAFGDEYLISPQFLFGTLGVYDLERERYIYNGSSTCKYTVISSNIIEIKSGVHLQYLHLDSGFLSDKISEINKSDENNISERTTVRMGLKRYFSSNFYTVIPIENSIYLAESNGSRILINRHGTFINEELEISNIPHWDELTEL